MLTRPFAPASRVARTALLWLALVMALAQLAAIRHAYSHTPEQASTQSGGKHPGGLAHCDACIAAVALGAGAPPAVPQFFAAPDQQLPCVVAIAGHTAPPQQRPYPIRAPPAIST